MYKNLRRMMKKKDKSSSKMRDTKTPNITSKRLTVPPGFLSQGVVSHTAGKNIVSATNDCSDDKENKYILKEDLHGLFNQFETSCDVQNQRRSARIQKKNVEQGVNNALSAAEYYSNILVKTPENTSSCSNEMLENVKKDRSKSIFKEINRKYAGVEMTNKLQSSGLEYREDNKYKISDHLKEQTMTSAFSRMLEKELSVHIREDSLKLCKQAINKKIEAINNVLVGRKNPSRPLFVESAYNVNDSSEELENVLPGFSFIPSSEWVYETPPGRKLRTSNIPKCTKLQPAVICKQEDHINIYELEPNSSVNLRRSIEKPFGDVQKTFIFKNSLQNNNMFEDISFCCHKNDHDKKFNFVKPLTQKKVTVSTSPPPKIAKWNSNDGTVVFSESEISHHKKDMIIDKNVVHPCQDIADDVTLIEDNGNYRLTSSQNIEKSFNFNFNSQMVGEHSQNFFVFNNNQLENGYTSYKAQL